MRIIAIAGSVRRGNSYAMVEAACHALDDCDVEFMHLKDTQLHVCDGCLTCDESGRCHFKDGMNEILPRMASADGFIFGTPSRWGLLSGELKVFLDRLNPLAVPEKLKGKKAVVFAVGQTKGKEAQTITSAAQTVCTFCEGAGITVVETVIAKDCLEADALISKHPRSLDACKKAARSLHDAILKA